MITGTAGQGALPLASRVLTPGAHGETARFTETGIAGRMQRGFVHGILGVLTVGAPLFAQPPGPEGLREEVDAQYRVTETSGGIGLLPRGDDRGIALIELRGEAVYIDGAGPLSVQRLTDELGADAAPLLRLRLLDIPVQRSVLGLPARPAGADADAAVAAGARAEAAGDAVADAAAVAGVAVAEAEDEVATADAAVAAAAVADAAVADAAVADAAVADAAVADAAVAAVAANAPPPPPAAPPAAGAPAPPAAPAEERQRRTVRRSIVRFGGDVHVPVDERLVGEVVLIGGRLRVDGEVTREVTVIGGSAEFGPEAVARREVTIVGGGVTRHPGARFDQGLNEVSFNGLDFDLSGLGSGPRFRWPSPPAPMLYRSGDLMGTFIRFAFLGLLGSVVLLVASGSTRRVAERVTREPVKAGVVGLLAQLLFLPLVIIGMVVLVVTIIGIPLLALVPVVCVAALVVLVLGFTGVVQLVSRVLARGERSDFMLFWAGLVLLMTPALFGDALDLIGGPFRLFAVILGVTGFLLEYLAWTTGSGAVILNWFGGVAAPAGGASTPPPNPPPVRPRAPSASLPPAGEPD